MQKKLVFRLSAESEHYVTLGALLVNLELGDYDPTLHRGAYVTDVRLAPSDLRTTELEAAVIEAHQLIPRLD